MIINRKLTAELKTLLKEYPVVSIIGPRQAGKTTLAKSFLKGFEYSNLEHLMCQSIYFYLNLINSEHWNQNLLNHLAPIELMSYLNQLLV